MWIRKIVFFSLLTLASGLVVVPPIKAQTRRAVAQIIGIVGQVYVKQVGASSWMEASLPTRLTLGDSVQVGEDSRAYIQYFRANDVLLGPGEVYGIAQEVESFFSRLVGLFADSEAGFFRTGRRGDEGATLFHYPRTGNVLSTQPAFAWFGESGHSYEIKVKETRRGDCQRIKRQMWQKPSADTSLAYPDDEPILQPGHHYWIGLRKEGGEWEDAVCVTVATAKEQESLDNELTELRGSYSTNRFGDLAFVLDSASLLLDRGYNTKALRSLEEARQRYPGEASIMFMLASAYETAGLGGLAQDIFRNAEESHAKQTAK